MGRHWIITQVLACGLSVTLVGALAGSTFAPAYLLTIIAVVVYAFRRTSLASPSFWFLLSYVALFLVAPLGFEVLDAPYEDRFGRFSEETVLTYTYLSILSAHLFCVGRELIPPQSSKDVEQSITSIPALGRALLAMSGVQVFAVLLLVFDQSSWRALAIADRLELQLDRGGVSLFATFLLYLALPLYVPLARYLESRPIAVRLVWLAALLLLEIALFLAYRIRTFFVAHALAFAVGWIRISRAKRESIRPRRGRQRILLLSVMVLTSLAAISGRFLRGYIGGGKELSEANIDLRDYALRSVQGGDFGYSPIVMRLIETVPVSKPFLRGQSYWRLLLVPIPRSLLPSKPPNTERIVAEWLYPQIEGLTIPPGVFGDLYINFGSIGIALMVLYGLMFSWLERRTGTLGVVFWGASFAAVFHFTRGGLTNPLLIAAVIYVGARFVGRSIGPPVVAGSATSN